VLSFNANLMEDLERQGFEPVVWARFSLHAAYRGGAAATFDFTNASDASVLGYPNLISGITAVAAKYDPLERTIQIDGLTIDLIDTHSDITQSEVRAMLADNYWRNKGVVVKFGSGTETSTANFETLWSGNIVQVTPEPGVVHVQCESSFVYIVNKEVTDMWIANHPLEVAELTLQYLAGVPTSKIDSSGLDINASSSKSHYAIKPRGAQYLGGPADGEFNRVTKTDFGRAWVGSYTIDDYTGLSGDTVTITECTTNYTGTNYTLTEGVDWNAVTSNLQTAINLRLAINGGAGPPNCTAGGSSNIVTVTRDATGGNVGYRYMHLAASDSVNMTTAETDIMDYFQDVRIGGMKYESSSADGSGYYVDLHPTTGNAGSNNLVALKLGKDPADATVAAYLPADGTAAFAFDDATPLAADDKGLINPVVATVAPNGKDSGLEGSVTLVTGLRQFFVPGSSGVGYFSVSDSPLPDRRPIGDILAEIAQLMDGYIYYAEDGKWTFVEHDSSAAAVATWTKDEIFNFTQLPEDNTINKVSASAVFEIKRRKAYSDSGADANFVEETYVTEMETREYTYVSEDTTAQADYSEDGSTAAEGVAEYRLDSKWVGGAGALHTAVTAAATTFRIAESSAVPYGYHVENRGMVGTRSPVSDPAAQRVDSGNDRLGYFLIGDEIVKATAQSKNGVGPELSIYSPRLDAYITPERSMDVSYTVARAQKSTTAAAYAAGEPVYDITLLVEFADRVVARWKYGLPVIRCETDLRQIEVQIGDFVQVEHELFLDSSYDGLDSGDAVKFEVISKSLDIAADPPRITWELIKV